MKKIIGLVIIFCILIGASFLTSAESISDPTGDVAHWNFTETAWGWRYNIGNKPDVDITELRQSVSDNKMIIEIVVAGTIQSSELNSYGAVFNTSDASYIFFWSNGTGGGFAMNTMGGFNFSEADVEVSGNTLTATFDLIGEDNTADFFWGYAWQYTNIGDVVTAEWWGDWVPNEESPFFGEDTGDTGDTGETGDTGDTGEENNKKSTDTPGFEFFIIFVSLIIFIFAGKRVK